MVIKTALMRDQGGRQLLMRFSNNKGLDVSKFWNKEPFNNNSDNLFRVPNKMSNVTSERAFPAAKPESGMNVGF